MAQSSKPQRERILIIVDMRHAERVRDAVVEYHEMGQKKRLTPTEARLASAISMALQAIFKRADGWYDTELRVAIMKMVRPRLSREELNRVMEMVYEVVPRQEETPIILQLRQKRRNATLASKS